MNAKAVIRQTYTMNEQIIDAYLNDLSDADLRLRSVGGMNPIAWQLGHPISSERRMIEAIRTGTCPPLPEGFAANHGPEATTSDDSSKCRTKAVSLNRWHAQREATKASLDRLNDAELDAPGPDLGWMKAATVGWVFGLTGTHVMMHVGHRVPVRRTLNKAIVI
ncbi:MAG: DinB family protein [Planctomycetaceae bacterium]|nr:DinB family protein [Planctomycetaceae bacterium]